MIEGSSSSTVMQQPLPSLPNELIEEILLRLPTKSLLRFASLSKKFEALISNPKFTKTHLNRLLLVDQSHNHQRLLVRTHRFPFSFYSTDYESHNSIPVHRSFPRFAPRGITIYGSCHGLLLACLNGKSLYLWNPSLNNNIRRLPRPNWFSGNVLLLGFGYDSSIDDYKVVRVVAHDDQKVEVYNLKTNTWRRIANPPFGHVTVIYEVGGTLVNGCLYWCIRMLRDKMNNNVFGDEHQAVLGFDLTNETFSFVQLPHEQPVPLYSLQLSVLNGYLAINQLLVETSFVLVWIFKESGENNEFVWTKLMKIPNAEDGCGLPICYRKSGEILLSMGGEWNVFMQLVLYNEKNLSCRRYLIFESNYWCVACTYLESLITL